MFALLYFRCLGNFVNISGDPGKHRCHNEKQNVEDCCCIGST